MRDCSRIPSFKLLTFWLTGALLEHLCPRSSLAKLPVVPLMYPWARTSNSTLNFVETWQKASTGHTKGRKRYSLSLDMSSVRTFPNPSNDTVSKEKQHRHAVSSR